MNTNGSVFKDLRRRRTECSIELRRQKRGDELMKRRNIDLATEEEDEQQTDQETGVKSEFF